MKLKGGLTIFGIDAYLLTCMEGCWGWGVIISNASESFIAVNKVLIGD